MSETLVQEIEAKAEAVAAEVKNEVVNVAEEVKAEVKKLTQELTTEEKLAIREIENTYLKAQIEINRLSAITQKAQKDFTSTVESLTKRYVLDPVDWLFDNIALEFRKK
jgi:Na+-translocating ferredoxin:NAD+ oxidoreductase RnfC subunit